MIPRPIDANSARRNHRSIEKFVAGERFPETMPVAAGGDSHVPAAPRRVRLRWVRAESRRSTEEHRTAHPVQANSAGQAGASQPLRLPRAMQVSGNLGAH